MNFFQNILEQFRAVPKLLEQNIQTKESAKTATAVKSRLDSAKVGNVFSGKPAGNFYDSIIASTPQVAPKGTMGGFGLAVEVANVPNKLVGAATSLPLKKADESWQDFYRRSKSGSELVYEEAQRGPLKNVPGAAPAFGVIGGLVADPLNFIGGGGVKVGRVALEKALLLADDIPKAVDILRKAKVGEDLIKIFAPKFAETFDAGAIKTGVSALEDALKTTKLSPLANSPLLQEARKYKSAEEFVKAQTNVYHGSMDKGLKLKDEALFLTDDFDSANTYAGGGYEWRGVKASGETTGFYAKEGKTLDLNKTENVKKILQDIYGSPKLKKVYDDIPESYQFRDREGDVKTIYPKESASDFDDFMLMEYQSNPTIKDGLKVRTGSYSFDEPSKVIRRELMSAYTAYGQPTRQSVYNNWEKIIKNSKEKGYDYIKHVTESPDASITFPETVALNPKKSLLTKSQLIDLWNKTTKIPPKISPLAQDISKAKASGQYKSAEDLIKNFDLTIKEKPAHLYRGIGGDNVQAQILVRGMHAGDNPTVAAEFASRTKGLPNIDVLELSPRAKIADLDQVKVFLAEKKILANTENITRALKDAGYDGAVGTLPGKGKEYIITNQRMLKDAGVLRERVADFYNQAVKGTDLTTSIKSAKQSGQSFDEWVKGQGENNWSKLQKTNPDLFNTGILRKSQAPYKAVGEIPKDVHSLQGKWQNYGQYDEVPADIVYKRIESGSFKGEYEDALGNAIRDKNGKILQDVYDDATGEWIKPNISNQELRDALLKQFETAEGKKYLNEVVNALPKNPDGTINAYRIGTTGQEGIQSYTLSEGMAKTFSNQGTDVLPAGTPGLPSKGYKEFGSLPVNVVKIDPKGIKAWSPYDAEILVEPKYVKTRSQLKAEWDGVGASKTNLGKASQIRPQPLPQPTTPSPAFSPKPPTDMKDISSFYNTARLNISQEGKTAIQQEIQNAKTQLEVTVGKTLTNKEVLDLADISSRTLNRTIGREETARRIAANLKLRQQIAAAAESGKVDENFIELWIKDKAAGEDIARQLQARRINADPQEASAIDALLESIYKVNKNADEIVKASKNVDFTKQEEVIKFYRSFVKPNIGNWVDLLRYNSMLSSPTTHLVNFSSNIQGTGLLAPIEKTITGGLDLIRSALTGTPRQAFAGEGLAYAKGFYANIGKASKNFWDVMKGKRFSGNIDVRTIPITTGGFARKAENVLALPSRLLEAADQFATTLTEAGVLKSLAYREGKGVAVKNPLSQASTEATHRLFRTRLGERDEGYLLDTLEFLPKKILEARNSDNPVIRWIGKLTFPFVNIGTQLFKQGIEYGPMGVATLAGHPQKIEQLSKTIIGSSIALAVGTLAGTDRLTFAEPTNADQKNAFRAAGRQPYSVKIGDKWISYSKFHPAIAWNFALVGAVKDALEKKKLTDDQADTILQTAGKYLNFFADQSYMKQIGDIVSATKGDAYGVTRFFSNFPTQFIPFRALMSWVERIVDPVQRQADPDGTNLEKQYQTALAQIPGLAGFVPERVGPKGEPIENLNRFINVFSPARITTEKPEAAQYYQNLLGFKKLASEKTDINAEAKKEMQPLYDRLQKLKAEGKVDEANAIYRALSKDKKETYNKIRASEKSKQTTQAEIEIFSLYKQLQQLKADGRGEEANAEYAKLSEEQKRAYQKLKAKFK